MDGTPRASLSTPWYNFDIATLRIKADEDFVTLHGSKKIYTKVIISSQQQNNHGQWL
jgi:hypothetical protein